LVKETLVVVTGQLKNLDKNLEKNINKIKVTQLEMNKVCEQYVDLDNSVGKNMNRNGLNNGVISSATNNNAIVKDLKRDLYNREDVSKRKRDTEKTNSVKEKIGNSKEVRNNNDYDMTIEFVNDEKRSSSTKYLK